MSTTQIESVKRFLKSNFMNAKQDWLQDCVEYILHEIGNDMQKIKDTTAQQWLLNDLKEVSSGCLPPNLKSQSRVNLDDKYVLQIISEIDIGTPAYQQYCKLTNVNDEDVEATLSAEEKIASHRMLKLSLTDGVQDVVGIEYKSINKIRTSLIPGSKVLIIGPVVCRSGVLFLENRSIELMGGEVTGLSNLKTEFLASKLGIHQGHKASIKQNIENSEKTKPPIGSHERLDSVEPPEKKQRTLSNDSINMQELNICTDNVKIVSSHPFIYIKQIIDMNESGKKGKSCRVKAQILYLLKKPVYFKDTWVVECKITDGTGCLKVQIDSDLFSNLVGYTPQEMDELKKKVLSNSTGLNEIKRDLVKKLGKAMETLKSLNCIMELMILPMPVIKKFIQFEKQHVILLKERLQGYL